jgi:hypothetical protein
VLFFYFMEVVMSVVGIFLWSVVFMGFLGSVESVGEDFRQWPRRRRRR